MPVKFTDAEAIRAGLIPPNKKAKRRKAKDASLPYPMFERLCEEHGLPIPVREYQFDASRKWRFDFCWPSYRVGVPIALEVDGGVWSGGRHARGAGIIGDQEKSNEAQLQCWIVLRCTPQDIESLAVFQLLKRALL